MALTCDPGTSIPVTEVIDEINNKSDLGHTHTKSEITDFAHTHAISDVTDLQTELDMKVDSNTTPVSGSLEVNNMIACTQAQYDGITPDANTFYVII